MNMKEEEEEKDYLIAGHRIRIITPKLAGALQHLQGFTPFRADRTGEACCCLADTSDEGPDFAHVYHRSLKDGIVSRFGQAADGNYVFDTLLPDGKQIYVWMDMHRHTAYFGGNLTPELLRLALWTAYGVFTVTHHTLAIHASTIVCQGRAVLFLGESGTGKSTHTRLWRENISDATLLNDDSPLVCIEDGQALVYGSPWSGKTPCYKNEAYPIAAFVRLSQAPYNRMKLLNTVKGFAALHPSCPPGFAYDERLYDSICQTLNQLLPIVPVYHLQCLPDAAAAQLSHHTLFNLPAEKGKNTESHHS